MRAERSARSARSALVWLLAFWPVVQAASALEEPLPVDPAVRLGRLDNGLTYYIRENHKPENRAQLRLVVNAGSVLEEDDQRGVAHFLEHMAFNGTRHFAKQALVNFLESIGMRFGADLNAYTSFDETVYFLEIPLDREEIVDQAFLILADWAHELTLDPAEIEAERGVVLEEWRSGLDASWRVLNRQVPVLFRGSRYAERLPIGQTNIIATAPREVFLRFYRQWYRPDLMALILVGDFEAEAMERRVRETFGPIPQRPDAPERPLFPVPDHQETLFSIVTDPELPGTSIAIAYKHPHQEERTQADYRRSLVESLYLTMLNARLEEKTRWPDPPYLFAAMDKMPLVRTKDLFLQQAAVKEEAWAEGLKAMLMEAHRVQRDGFTASELDRARANLLRSYERAYAERDKRESGSYAAEYTRHFLTGEPIPGIEEELRLAREFLPAITLEEVNHAASRWITLTNRVILYSAPEKPGLAVPREQDILAVLQEAARAELQPYRDELAERPLLDPIPEPRPVVRTNGIPDLGLIQWELANGVRVWAKPTDFKNDEVLVTAFSPGGLSLVDDEDLVAGQTAAMLVGQSGLGDYDLTQLRKKLAGRIAAVGAFLNETSEGLSGSASPRDLETLFQLIHLTFTRPRADQRVFSAIQTNLREQVRNRLNDPAEVFADELERVLYGGHPRHRLLDEAWIRRMDPERSLAIFRDRFANAGDFHFLFVGRFDPPQLQRLAERYLATLPAFDRPEGPVFRGDDPVRGRVSLRVFKGLENRSEVRLLFTGDTRWEDAWRLPLQMAVEVLRIRLRETLREEEGGVYGVGVSGHLQRWPKGAYACRVAFTCDPGRADQLISLVLEEIRRLQQKGPRAEDLAKVRQIALRSFERGQKENPFWLGNLEFRVRHDLDPRDILSYPDRVRTLTGRKVAEAARRYFAMDNLLIARLEPGAKTGGPGQEK